MTGAKIITASIFLVTSCAGGRGLTAADVPPPSHRVQHVHRSGTYRHSRPVPAQRSRTIRRTWQTGPASSAPVTELIPSRPASSPPRISGSGGMHSRAIIQASARQPRPPAARSANGTVITVTDIIQQAPIVKAGAPATSNPPDPEAQRVQEEFVRLRVDAAARQAFYSDLLGTVQRVRAGVLEEQPAAETPVSYQPAAQPIPTPAVEPMVPSQLPAAIKPVEPAPAKPRGPQSLLGPYGAPVDQVAYQRVVRWAKANNAPVALALGVAWMESRLNTSAPRGAAGEVGMFQIMPERCRLEGWPSQRLSEPEFNAWMGTLLLARYYREEGSVARAAAKYVAGPGVFNKKYSKDVWDYITWYANTVDTYASYFAGVPS